MTDREAHDPFEYRCNGPECVRYRAMAAEMEHNDKAGVQQPSDGLRETLERMREFAEHDLSCLFAADLSGINGDQWQGLNARPCSCGFDNALALYDAAIAGVHLGDEGLDVERLGLNDEQSAILTDLLASRQQTVSEWLSDVLMDMGLGRVTGRDYAAPSNEVSSKVWAEALADPKFVASLDEGLADMAAGRTVPLRAALERMVGLFDGNYTYAESSEALAQARAALATPAEPMTDERDPDDPDAVRLLGFLILHAEQVHGCDHVSNMRIPKAWQPYRSEALATPAEGEDR